MIGSCLVATLMESQIYAPLGEMSIIQRMSDYSSITPPLNRAYAPSSHQAAGGHLGQVLHLHGRLIAFVRGGAGLLAARAARDEG